MAHADINKWITFINERFSPYIYIPFLLLYFSAHFIFVLNDTQYSLPSLITLYIVTIIFFLKLRLYDEVKDFETDLKIHPDRPLPRGSIEHSDLHRGIFICIALELFIFSVSGFKGLLAITIPLVYSLLMFKEFFIRKWLRSNLFLYAITHTFVSSLFSLSLLSILQSKYIYNLSLNSFLFALMSWCVFNIFEFGRKTFLSSEEKKDVDSYSKNYGRFGAVCLVILMAIFSLIILNYIESSRLTDIFTSILVGLLTSTGILFVKVNKQPFGNIYRGACSVFIASLYLIYIILN